MDHSDGGSSVIHSIMSQMLYAGLFVAISAPADQLQRSAELMYYGGDITEMLLAFAMVSTWRTGGRTGLAGAHSPRTIDA